ncbi:helix-turn-helix domain-containing protein [Saccharibacillus endophyticus]|uniref:MerR family transcriptional regulator n=1 Tax=Saccharibacillus endophyticus TaxID=2060666 RepID=A0ABQ2A4N9_9BACL|nr:helix-turn-helix domain-containing protein [Saccharibacillus endophyticus]GGH85302.1 MerR family transcriptional regulator [Saccharibacillus endophyticus]
MKTYWTIEEVAQELGVTTRTIRNYLKSGELSGTKIGGQWRFTVENIRKLVGANSPLISFSENKVIDNNYQEVIMAFNLPIKSEKEGSDYRNLLLEQYNEVYSGENRNFYYEIVSPELIRIILSGSAKYVLNFGTWIEQKLY